MLYKAFVKDKETGKASFMEYEYDSKSHFIDDLKHNGYTVIRVEPKELYDFVLENTNGDKYDWEDAKKLYKEGRLTREDHTRMRMYGQSRKVIKSSELAETENGRYIPRNQLYNDTIDEKDIHLNSDSDKYVYIEVNRVFNGKSLITETVGNINIDEMRMYMVQSNIRFPKNPMLYNVGDLVQYTEPGWSASGIIKPTIYLTQSDEQDYRNAFLPPKDNNTFNDYLDEAKKKNANSSLLHNLDSGTVRNKESLDKLFS